MSLILCPECGAKISDKATSCPHCGFMSDDHSRPISEQDSYEVVPTFVYDIEKWEPKEGPLNVVGVEDNRALIQHFGNWRNIQRELPAIAQVIQSMADRDKVLVAKMDSYVKKLIDKGIYRFTVDKTGEILPTIRDSDGIVKQVRLKETTFSSDLMNSLNNLAVHAAMAQILDELEYVGNSIHIELQNDRIALAESTRDELRSAVRIQDTKLRETAILNTVSSATEAKRILMRNFSENLQFISENSDKSTLKLLREGKKGKDIPLKAEDSFQSLVAIINTVQVECEGYAMLGEYGSSNESLLQFKKFIIENNLDKRDTLLLLNENTPQKNMPVVNDFMRISERIMKYDDSIQLNGRNIFMIAGENQDETE